MGELLPRVLALAALARRHDIGLNIDAEEADRLDLSLDILEALCFAPELAGWDGIGFVVQAYGKRAFAAVDWLVDLARRSGHRLMVRLVKGAYWDSEIKRAQVDGLEGFPVFTRKVHTDVSFLACARKLLDAPDAVFPQFATHNAQTLAAVHAMAGEDFRPGRYEFQCLHGMGEPLYEEVVGPAKLDRPCRIYAPVGTHETLLAYLVRRLLENGANSSFVNRIGDATVPVEALIADPVEAARAIAPVGAPHPRIALPRALFGAARANSAGLDLSNEQRLASLSGVLLAGARAPLRAAPMLGDGEAAGEAREVRNPADRRDLVGSVVEATPETVDAALGQAAAAAPLWGAVPPAERAACLHARSGADGRADAGAPRADSAGSRQIPRQRCFRGAGSGGLPALLRRAGAGRVHQRHASAARAGRLHQPLELPARHLHGPGRGGARGRQPGARQAGGGNAADCRARGAPACARPACRPPPCSSCPATARSGRASWPIRASAGSCSPARPTWRG